MKSKYKISTEIYNDSHIEDAIVAFEEVAKIEYQKWELFLEGDTESEIDELFNEFMNYVIYLINE
jgi:hypothetical protein